MHFGLSIAFWYYKSFTCGQLLAILSMITIIILYWTDISEYHFDNKSLN
ncbi:sulfatase [Photorhabdus stackebrandtii]|uniref:Sulfatase n=1 Tax=Photorhabdus stackebrandtii TaxID=1123042 RepID=A0A7X5TM48_9GAMM|nr:sulfatase [Photorhabdus stackebrandtii]